MDNTNRSDVVRRLLDGNPDPAEQHELQRQIDQSAELRAELEQCLRLRQLLQETPPHFSPYFSTRVMAHLQARPWEEEWTGSLLRVFRRVALAACVLAIVMLGHNVITQWDQRATKSPVELTLGIPSATIASSLDYLDYWL